MPLHTHLAETAFEVEQSRREHGMPVVPWVKKQRLFDARVLAAHCVHVDEGEIRALKDAARRRRAQPDEQSEARLRRRAGAKMLELGVAVGIGTDGTASNNDLDMFEEMRLAALLAKGISGDPTALPARQALAMATRIGARAMHLGDITGSLEPGKRADLIVVDLDQAHNVPRFGRDPNAVYSQLVYAAKSTDVVDVMCDGQWLMRDRRLLTLDEDASPSAARDVARRIDAFLIRARAERPAEADRDWRRRGAGELRGAGRRRASPRPTRCCARWPASEITVIRAVHYHQYDTYFFFDDPSQGRLRYREDEFLDEQNEVTSARARLTLTGPSREAAFGSVLLFRSRFFAPATHSPRFYREYFKPQREREIEKDRRRWLVGYRGVQFYVHVDRLMNPPADGYFLEVKSRTWSRRDAQDKAAIITELLERLGARSDETIEEDYVEL